MSPEFLAAQLRPHVMLTYVEVEKDPTVAGHAADRLRQHVLRKTWAKPETRVNRESKRQSSKGRMQPNTVLKQHSMKARCSFNL